MRKLLVANRSEIAIRCFRAATELGLRTVAIYSQEDRFSLHRYKADEAFLIGPTGGGEPVRSYLNMTAILEVAAQNGVDAIHPGYGFLSENAAFARLCAEHAVTFIGPPARAARRLRRQDRVEAARAESGGADGAGERRCGDDTRRCAGGGQNGRLSGHGQGELRRRRPRHADGRATG